MRLALPRNFALVLPLWTILATDVSAQDPFADYSLINPSIGDQFATIEPVDLDLDGDIDVVTGDFATERLVWYENRGDGSMRPGVELSRDLTGLGGVAVADFDQDGLPDLCFTSIEAGVSAVHGLRNLGGGEFAPVQVLSRDSIDSGFLHAQDLDGDGDIDLLIEGFDRIVWLDGLGSGSFAPPIEIWQSVDSDLAGLEIGDLTGDGLLDIVMNWSPLLYGSEGKIELIPQQAMGGFGQRQLLLDLGFSPRQIALFDADLDGDRDILVVDDTFDTVSWLRYDGSGQFGPQLEVVLTIPNVLELLPTDLDNDGSEDLLYAANGGQGTTIRIGEALLQTPLSFQFGQELTNVGSTPRLLARADLDQDGLLDLIHTNIFDRVLWHRSAPGGTYAPPIEITDPVSGDSVAIIDLDLDGLLDAVVIGSPTQLYRRTPSGAFDRSVTFSTPATAFLDSHLVDINHDGFPDIVGTYFLNSLGIRELYWTPGIPGGFDRPVLIESYSSGESFGEPATVDLDQDGDLDLVCVSTDPILVSTYENLGNGAFGPRSNTPFPVPQPFVQDPADLTGDGLPDIVIRTFGQFAVGDQLFVGENLGNGSIGPFVEIGQPVDRIHDVDYGDLDQDGDLDVVVVQDPLGSVGEVARYVNEGGLDFGQAETLFTDTTVGFGFRVEIKDWDQDGLKDLVVLSSSRREVFLYRVLGPNQLGPREILLDLNHSMSNFVLADLDKDLDPDVVLYDPGLGALRVYSNERALGEGYCASTPNSTGQIAGLAATGSPFAVFNGLALHATMAPPGTFGYFLNSMTPGLVQQPGNSQGVLCLGGDIGRYNQDVLVSDASGTMGLTLDLAAIPAPGGFVSAMAGQTWYFQGWFRDTNPNATSNFTNGLRITLD